MYARCLVAIDMEPWASLLQVSYDADNRMFSIGQTIRRAMKFLSFGILTGLVRKGREALRQTVPGLRPEVRRSMPGRYQPYSHTLPDRYPWLFMFARDHLGNDKGLRILSFGCSRGEEVFSLRNYFPTAEIKGIDIDPSNIAACLARVNHEGAAGITFAAAATAESEPTESYDAIFCLAVLCRGDLTTSGAQRCDPDLRFDNFERMVADFTRSLRPGGLLLLHTTNFRFCDTAVAQNFDVVLEADPADLAPDVLFDRNNKLMPGERYSAVGFRKRGALRPAADGASLS
jgi:SAM-dependent methyltransferase